MKISNIFFSILCVSFFIIFLKDLIAFANISKNESILNPGFSLAYKTGLIVGKIIKIVAYFALTKFLFDKYLKNILFKTTSIN